jgi:hypothetical protein
VRFLGGETAECAIEVKDPSGFVLDMGTDASPFFGEAAVFTSGLVLFAGDSGKISTLPGF